MRSRQKPRQADRPRHFIRQWRKHRGLTQEQLAQRVDVVVSSISQLETGKQGYSQSMLENLASALACEPWDLLNVDPSKEGEVVDLTRLLREASPELKAEAIGFVKGLLRSNER